MKEQKVHRAGGDGCPHDAAARDSERGWELGLTAKGTCATRTWAQRDERFAFSDTATSRPGRT